MNNICGIVICHASLAESFLFVLKNILGHTNHLYAFSNTDKSLASLKDELEQFIDAKHIKQIIFFVDLKGGSCWSASRQLLSKYESIAISGVNVPMLLNFSMKCEQYDSPIELADMLIESAKNSIMWSEK